MSSTPISSLFFVSLILFQYAGVSLSMDQPSSLLKPHRGVPRSSDSDRQFTIEKLQDEINALSAELAEAHKYISAGHGPIPTAIYRNWATRLKIRLDSAERDFQNLIHAPNFPQNLERQWYAIGNEKKNARLDIAIAGYHWIDLTPRPQNQSAILQSEHYKRLWQDIGNMNEEWSDLGHSRVHLQNGTKARKLYNEAMNRLESRIKKDMDYSRDLVSGFVQPQPREDYQPGMTYRQLMEAFQKHGLDWERVHAHILPKS